MERVGVGGSRNRGYRWRGGGVDTDEGGDGGDEIFYWGMAFHLRQQYRTVSKRGD